MSRRQLSAIQKTGAFERERFKPAEQQGPWQAVGSVKACRPQGARLSNVSPPLPIVSGPSREAEKERLYDTLAFGREAAQAKAVGGLPILVFSSTLFLPAAL